MARRKFNREFKISAVQLVNHQGYTVAVAASIYTTEARHSATIAYIVGMGSQGNRMCAVSLVFLLRVAEPCCVSDEWRGVYGLHAIALTGTHPNPTPSAFFLTRNPRCADVLRTMDAGMNAFTQE